MNELLEREILKAVMIQYLDELQNDNIDVNTFLDFILDYIETITNEKTLELLEQISYGYSKAKSE
jgi:hypothetical protein|tara:strand:+ start:1476 stop:1670 length:195 start_codon:yes stop_codon:yes gene_type:complete